MILLIDNYDSFAYNLYQLVGTLNPDIKVIRNDELTIEEIRALKPQAVILSPGPGRPEDAGVCQQAVTELGKDIPLLGVCLGHQAICQAYGGTVTYAKKVMHGKQSLIQADSESVLFNGMEPQMTIARYHSLAADRVSLPDCLKITAETEDGEVMAVEHVNDPVFGVQFHPESILTPGGVEIIKRFLAVR